MLVSEIKDYPSYLDRPKKQMANTDMLREMSDETLADWLCRNKSCAHCIGAQYCWPGHNGMLAWLRRPAEV